MTQGNEPTTRSIALPVLFALICLFLWTAQLTFDPGDWPSPNQFPHNQPTENACGRAGAFVSYHLTYFLGDGAYPLLLFATCAAILWMLHGHILNLTQRIFGLALLICCTSSAAYLVSPPGPHMVVYGNGGLLGAGLGQFLLDTFAGMWTALALAYGFFIGLLFTAEGWMLRLPDAMKRTINASLETVQSVRDRLPKVAIASAPVNVVAPDPEPETRKVSKKSSKRRELRINTGQPEEETSAEVEASPDADGTRSRKTDRQENLFEDDPQPPRSRKRHAKSSDPDEQPAKRKKKKSASNPVTVNPTQAPAAPVHTQQELQYEKPPQPAEAYPRPLSEWNYPPLTMLGDPEYTFNSKRESDLRAKAKILESTLEDFRLDTRVVEIDTGPVITLFELEIGAGIKVSQFSALANDIARALKAPSIRIIAPIPGKNTVGVEVPNAEKEKVRIKALLMAAGPRLKDLAIPLFLGKDASGNPLIADLAAMPHMLIAGTTGSVKSVSINSIIMSILLCRRPDHVKLILIDPKMVEMSQFKEVPHLMAPIVTDMARAEKILDWAVTKMDERYALIAEARVRNIASYNALGEEEVFKRLMPATDQEKKAIPTRLPFIVIMIDELADLMMTSGKEVEHHLARLAQKSRAVGIHIVVATQRPEAKVVTGLIKSNLPCRIAFRVASRMDSRIVLDQNGAEVLMGQGDMLFLPPGSHKLHRAQGTYIEDEEINQVIEFLCKQGKAEFHPELVKIPGTGADVGELDPLYNKAVLVVLDTKRGSVSLLQRRLTIGYSRASRLIEQMAGTGIVGEYKGSQAREVLITADEWDAMNSRGSSDNIPNVPQAPEAYEPIDLAMEPDDPILDTSSDPADIPFEPDTPFKPGPEYIKEDNAIAPEQSASQEVDEEDWVAEEEEDDDEDVDIDVEEEEDEEVDEDEEDEDEDEELEEDYEEDVDPEDS